MRINYYISPKLKITLRYEHSGGQKMHLSLKGRNYDIFHCIDRTVKIQRKNGKIWSDLFNNFQNKNKSSVYI